jgi:phosphatidate cytidylyltransferase
LRSRIFIKPFVITPPATVGSAGLRRNRVLRWRLISAAVILAVLFSLGWLDYRLAVFKVPGAWLWPVLLVVSVLATEEVLSLLRAKNHRPIAWIAYVGNVAIPLAACLPLLYELGGRKFPLENPLGQFGWPLVAFALAALLTLVGEMGRFTGPGTAIVNAGLGIFTQTYIGVLISFWPLLRLFGNNGSGMAALFSTLLIVKMSDVGAFTFGKNLGRTKMTPVLSPGKTWEGTLGGLAVAALTSWAFFHYIGPSIVGSGYQEPPVVSVVIYGILLAVAGMLGDLAESMLKRDMERKDSSTWLPGLGGVLDIIDAVLFAGPVAWLCWVVGLVGPGA